ncbi:MAG: rhamnogalacturonan acetylesterase [Planctomycetota bacterium]|nr:rhamnogalacturonan acetylesterase [Planctomycetota bacterium]
MLKHLLKSNAAVAACSVMTLAAATLAFADTAGPVKFSFSSAGAPGYVQVAPTAQYSDTTGYGFEPGSKVTIVDRGGSEALRSGYVTSDHPFFFSVKVPEGNYRITLTLGDSNGESVTTVKTELRRLALEQAHTSAGEIISPVITANVRQPRIPGGGAVKLKGRETSKNPGGEWAEWDDKLTFEFSDKHPALCALSIEKADELPTVYLCGDSTVCDQPSEPFNSWGQMLPRWFKGDVVIANQAESGETLGGFYAEGRIDKIMSTLKKGDYVFVQFGHNDMKAGANEPPEKYKAFYARLVGETIAKGATPVILTPVSRKSFNANGQITNSFKEFPDKVRELAKEQDVAFIDLQNISARFYEALGKANITPVFANAREGTHHSDYGSYEIAKCVVQGIIDDKLPLAASVVDDWKPFDPSHPDLLANFTLPPDPSNRNVATPLGN